MGDVPPVRRWSRRGGALDPQAGTRSPVERPRLQEAVTRRILDLIRARGLEPGDRLPPAQALAEHCAVAVPTVREALRRLEATGAIEIRHGSGIYLRSGLDRLVLPNPYVHSLQRETIHDLLEVRMLLEPHTAERAARRAGDADLQRLSGLLDGSRAYLDGSDDTALHDANMHFHRGIAALSGNRVASQVLDSLIEVYRVEQREILEIFADRGRDHDEHRQILSALQRHRPALARRLMRQHLTDVRSVVIEQVTYLGKAPPAADRGIEQKEKRRRSSRTRAGEPAER